jgi:hypothetical protein
MKISALLFLLTIIPLFMDAWQITLAALNKSRYYVLEKKEKRATN